MKNKNKKVSRLVGFLMGGAGLFLLLSVAFPVFSYDSLQKQHFTEFLSPIPEEDTFIKASNWFPEASQTVNFTSSIAYYNISIPKLGIKDAVVSVGGEDLADSLIQYPGTALPGKIGNSVIFGHSALPSFYNPHEYLTIFSTLPTLKKGDTISVIFDGISYTYKVVDLYEVLPTDFAVLNQPSDSANLSLITCVPPGDPRSPRRLVVKTALVPAQEINNYDNNRI